MSPVALIMLLCVAVPAAADALPWTEARLLHAGSEPPLAYEATHRLAREDGRFATLTGDGLSTFVLRDGSWEADRSTPLSGGVAVAWADGTVVALDRQKLLLVRPTGERVVIHDLACPSGSHGAVAGVPGRASVLVAIGGRVYLLNTDDASFERVEGADLGRDAVHMASSAATGEVYAFGGRGLSRWDHEARQFVAWTDAEGNALSAPPKSLAIHPDGRWLYAGTAGEGLLAVDLQRRAVHPGSEERLPNVAGQHIFPVTVDTRRDVLYVPSWTHVIAVAPASDPAAWEEIGYLNAMTEPALHTYRAVATVAGMAYLPGTDHLVFGGRWGLDVLTSPESGQFVRDEGFDAYLPDEADLPGAGPVYEMIRDRRLRAIYVNAGRATPEAMEQFARAGINAVFYQTYFIEHGEFYPPFDVREHLREVAGWAEDAGVTLFATGRQVGWSQFNHERIRDYEYRRFVTPSGRVGSYQREHDVEGYDRGEFPCHFDEGYWELTLGYQIEEFGKLAAEAPIAGFVLEMGDGYSGSNISAASDTCMCDDCWERFLDARGIDDPEARGLQIDGWNRYHWLNDRDLREAYAAYQQERFAALTREYLLRARAHQPELAVALALPETSSHYDESWYYRAWIDGLGTAERPVIVCSQQAYGAPFSPTMSIDPGRRFAEHGLHLLFVPGLATIWHTPEQLARRTADNLRYTPGTWYYHGNYWFGEHLDENIYQPRTPGVEGSFPLSAYIEALGEVRWDGSSSIGFSCASFLVVGEVLVYRFANTDMCASSEP
ncbi:MAG: YncE family protein, partial [Armatimonadota bacterium]